MVQWPTHSKIKCFNMNGDEIATSKRSRLDLADSLMLHYHNAKPKLCLIEVSTNSKKWGTWNKKNVIKIEDHIRYDLQFDGYDVVIKRVSTPGKTLCSKPFRWELEISNSTDDEDLDNINNSAAVGTRFKVARSDASIKTIQSTIEKIFGLPKGSVSLLTPEGKKANTRSSIRKLRNKWKGL